MPAYLDHLAVLSSIERERVALITPPFGAERFRLEVFEEMWSGKALLITAAERADEGHARTGSGRAQAARWAAVALFTLGAAIALRRASSRNRRAPSRDGTGEAV